MPQCINCAAAKKIANHATTSTNCPFFKARYSCMALTTLLRVIHDNKFQGYKSPFNSCDFDLNTVEAQELNIPTIHGSLQVLPDGSTKAPAKKHRKKVAFQ